MPAIKAAGSGGGAARTIIYVHGIGNKPRASVLKCQWDTALCKFDLGDRSRLAYWVNRERYPDPAEGTCASSDDVVSRGSVRDQGALSGDEGDADIGAEIQALASSKGHREALGRLAAEIQQSAAKEQAGSVQSANVQGQILWLPKSLRERITKFLTRALLKDVYDLLFVTARRAVMRQSLEERLKAGSGPFVVIGHSQGSIIAYDVLARLPANSGIHVELFLTIGSPLGIQEVQDQLLKLTNQAKLKVPRCVARWVNVADRLDPVAVDMRLGNDFQPHADVRVEDIGVTNPDSPTRPHSGTGYLSTAIARQVVSEAVETGLFQPVAPFVIARDAVRALENGAREERHKILIELLDPADAGVKGLDAMRRAVVRGVEKVSGLKPTDPQLNLEELNRFVAVRLTRAETEHLAGTLATGSGGPSIRRMWRNAVKCALLDKSIHTVQAFQAHTAYHALGERITWAVLDSGIAHDHPHFRTHDNIRARIDCTVRGRAREGAADDAHGHGSHVAGIIAGTHSIDRKEVSGIAPRCGLYVYKVLDEYGNGDDAWIIKALDHVAETNARSGRLVIHGVNLSLGGDFDPNVFNCGHTPLCSELRRLWRQGVIVVLAAGNQGFAVLQSERGPLQANIDLSISDPANLDEAIAVGSVHKENPHSYGVSYFSSRGPTSDGRAKPDCVAPGERILSCRHTFPRRGGSLDKLYVEMSGTSMAAPHVSGVLPAFLSARTEFVGHPDRVKKLLLENCTDLGRDKPIQGAGLPNLVRMLVTT